MSKITSLAQLGGQFGRKIDVAGTFSNPFGATQNAVKTLPEQLAEMLVELIINGSFAPGQRLYEMSLAEQFSVSRGPVREALRLLEREGLVTMTSRKGASVTVLTEKRLANIFSVRSALMAICAEDLAKNRDDATLAVLDEGTRRLFALHEHDDVGEFIVIVYQLSMYIAEAADNDVAKSVLFSLGRQTLSMSRRVFELPERRLKWAEDWKGIVEAIREQDPERAHQSVRPLLDHIKAYALEVYHQQYGQPVKKKAVS